MSGSRREILADADAVAARAAELLVAELAATAGPAAVCLSGGSTPRRLYLLLATAAWRARIPWERVHWFWGDERCVPHDHPDSNFGMTRAAMLDSVNAPAATVHPVPTAGLEPEAAAAAYAGELQRWYGAATLDPSRPLFAVNLLGLGEDGHTASLFPGAAVLAERERWAVSVTGARPEPRVSLTYPVLESARLTLMLVTGAAKRMVLARLATPEGAGLPAARLRPAGTCAWLLDRAAAG
ncbi:MAG: 6-phosphogluconolactonase [Burkholderiaceae bacterium]|nr:6-phosphogluconolactonase [Burkholderiaceae bacterium]